VLALLLRRALEQLLGELDRRLAAAGFGDIRPVHGCVFENIEPSGSRLTDLSARAHLTKSTLVYVVDDLERLGYVERVPDPQDRRSKLVRLTPKGASALETGRRIIDAIEAEWSARIGVSHVAALRTALERLDADETR
jgi:DNA-binding MarR family transcriptional regulator